MRLILSVSALAAVFLIPLTVVADEADAPLWSSASAPFLESRYAAYMPFEKTTIAMQGSQVDAYLSAEASAAAHLMTVQWMTAAATAVASYYGNFPVPKVSLVLLLKGGAGIHSGVTFSGRLIRMEIGRETSKWMFTSDWTMTHEMFHLGFPDVGDEHLWMEEGEAVYLEPIARARIGNISAEQLWSGMVEGMSNGLPESGDRGLNRTHTWGRTYWGGTLFWLLADIKIRQQSANKHTLDDAMRAILKAGGDGREDWPVQRVLDLCDKATETHVVSELYEKMALAPMTVDLMALWKSLGVQKTSKGHVRFDDTAPLADIRKSIGDPAQNPKN